MKRILIIFMVSILIIIMIGCQSDVSVVNKEVKIDEEILELVKYMEETDVSYYEFDISYDEYLEELDKMKKNVSKTMGYSDEELKKFHFKRCHLIEFNIDASGSKNKIFDEFQQSLNEGANKLFDEGGALPFDIRKSEISKVYNDTVTGFKYVIIKRNWGKWELDTGNWQRIIRAKNDHLKWLEDQWVLKKYNFIKEDGEWKLISIDTETQQSHSHKIEDASLNKINCEPVEYIEMIEH